jgi:hypothetical protein
MPGIPRNFFGEEYSEANQFLQLSHSLSPLGAAEGLLNGISTGFFDDKSEAIQEGINE